MEQHPGFPPFDESQRPSTDERGRELAPETFRQWVAPAVWEDTDGQIHCDIRMFHRWLGWTLTDESCRETAGMFQAILEGRVMENAADAPAMIIER